MAKIDDGGPAFPAPGVYDGNGCRLEQGELGMTLRDHFAGLALAHSFEPYGRFSETAEESQRKQREHLARQCYAMADAMLAARSAA